MLDSESTSLILTMFSFLLLFHICKILGLRGIDLFSPSDAVEKRNIRKVCICIRALSRKARTKQLNVPDFDMVTYTVPMRTDIVGGIRRSLEFSQYSFSGSSSYSSFKHSRGKSRQKNSTETFLRNIDSWSEGSDEAESTFVGAESLHNNFEHAASPHLDAEVYPGAYSIKYPKRQSSPQYDKRNRYTEDRHDQYNNGTLKLLDTDHALENSAPIFGDSLSDNGHIDYISDYLAFSDSIVHGDKSNSPMLFDADVKDNIYNFFMGIDSHESDSNHKTSPDEIEDAEVSSTTSMSSVLGRALYLDLDDRFDADYSPTNIYASRVLENEAENQLMGAVSYDTGHMAEYESPSHSSSTDIEHEFELKFKKLELKRTSLVDRNNGKGMDGNEDDNDIIVDGISDSDLEIESGSIIHIPEDCLSNVSDVTSEHSHDISNGSSVESNRDVDGNLQYMDMAVKDVNVHITDEPSRVLMAGIAEQNSVSPSVSVAEKHPCSTEVSDYISEGCESSDQAHSNNDKSDKINLSAADYSNENDVGSMAEKALDGEKDGFLPEKRQPRPLLKTVAKGTAIVGLLFLVFHIRKGREKDDEGSNRKSQSQKLGSSKFSSKTVQKGCSTAGVYPSENLKFGN